MTQIVIKKLLDTNFPIELVTEQALLRCRIISIFIFVIILSYLIGLVGDSTFFIVTISLSYTALSFILLFTVNQFPNKAKAVSISGILSDIIVVTIVMIHGGSGEAAFYGSYLFLIIGNGLRFGKAYMRFVHFIAIIGFILVIMYGEFWQQDLTLGIGLLVWLILIPLYLNVLLTRLEKALEKSESANDAKTMFVANMSHEIRTPLTAIVGFGKTLLNENLSSKKKSIAINTIIRNGTYLSSIVNDILDISKIEAGKLDVEFRKCGLFEIVQEIDFLFRQKIEDEGKKFSINYQFPIPAEIFSDSLRIKQILINLCSNAIKFTSLGEISISISYDQETQLAQFAVKDSGIGIEKDQLASIFASFIQADLTTTRKYGGTGLGLSISKRLALMLDGDLWVSSVYGEGSTFSFSIKCGDIATQSLVKKAPSHSAMINEALHKNTRVNGEILLVEDVVDNQVLIQILLEDLGAKVEIAENGKIAIEKALNKNFDLILMDMQMPVMGGVDAISTLRQRKYTGPIVILSANVIQDEETKSNIIDCQGFLSKPVNEEKLASVVVEHLGGKSVKDKSASDGSVSEEVDDNVIISKLMKKNSTKYTSIINRFAEQLHLRIHEIEEAFNAKNYSELQQFLHKLKGVGGNMGFHMITDETSRCETLISNEDYSEIPTVIANLYLINDKIQRGLNTIND